MKIRNLIAASALALAIPGGAAFAQGGLYVLHSDPAGGCPALDWHVVVAAGGGLSGVIGWDNMKHIARVTGMLDRKERTFQMTANEVGGAERAATISGQVEANNFLKAEIKGPTVDCKDVMIPYYLPPKYQGGG